MILVLAMILDAVAGEPRWLWDRVPHPAVLIGRAIDWADERFNEGEDRKRNGILFCCALCGAAAIVGWIITILPFGGLLELIAAAILLAQRSLVDHVSAVGDALRLSLGDGRRAVARIVGRDTRDMDEAAVARAAIESGAENFSDGVVAPVFWFAALGLPGLLIYKAVNTADSMIGHMTPRYARFGWAAARLDDVLNWVPARLSALILLVAAGRWADLPKIRGDARLHRSPNAGWPEAAMALILNVALSGPRSYDGQMQEFPFVHADGNRTPGPADIDRAVVMLWRGWTVLLLVAFLLVLF